MFMKPLITACMAAGILWLLPAGAYAKNCTGLPTSFNGNQFPTGNFISNFDNNCYLIPFASGNGTGSEQGDTNSVYDKLYFTINPNLPPYELVILGQYPNARYFSVGLYDNHSAVTQNLTDANIVPLSSSYVNPFQPGVAFVSAQQWGMEIKLGGTPGTLQKGCMMTGYNIESNVMDGTLRHPYMNWNLNPSFFHQSPQPVLHEVDTPQHSDPNTAGTILVRTYIDLTALTANTQPHVIVRDVASGCAYPASYVTGTMNVVTTNSTTGNSWLNQTQVQEHNVYANWQATDCWGTIPYSRLQWLRSAEYTAGANPDSSYLYAYVPSGLTQTLLSSGEVLRLRFQVPTTPPTPCTNGCSRSGDEQIRYESVSFQVPGGATLASVADSCPANPVNPCTGMVQLPGGYVTLLVSVGVPQPSWATAANGYTWLDLSQVGNSNYMQLNQIAIRGILPAANFQCAAQEIPYKVSEATTGGAGLMGLYAPLIDYPAAANLPTTATPVTGNSACAVFPSGPPGVSPSCTVLTPPTVTISTVSTECAAVGCNQVTVQPQPAISVTGTGFGSLPMGLPYNGNSNFVEITDTTQNWSAGYTGNACNISIGEWSTGLVSFVANVNETGSTQCPMAAGDQLNITIWNPQTLASASTTVTVAAQSDISKK